MLTTNVIITFLFFFILVPLLGSPFAVLCKKRGLEALMISFSGGLFMISQIQLLKFIFKEGCPLEYYFLAFFLFSSAWIIKRNYRSLFASDMPLQLANSAIFFCLTILGVFTIQIYSGGAWSIDWYMHYKNALEFTSFDNITISSNLIKRPPLMNLVEGFVLSNIASNYYIYALISTLMNSLCIIPILSFAKQSQDDGNSNLLCLSVVTIALCNPMIFQNATYTWTKLLATFFLLNGLFFYCQHITTKSKIDLSLVGVMLSLALFSHWSVLTYIVGLGLLHLIRLVFFASKAYFKASIKAVLYFIAVQGLWIIWVLYNYSLPEVFGAYDPLYRDPSHISMPILISRFVLRLKYDIFPLTTITYLFTQIFPFQLPEDKFFLNRDLFFLSYQTTILGGLGIAGTISMLVYFLDKRFETVIPNISKISQLVFVLISLTAIWCIISWNEETGMAHLYILPVTLLSLLVTAKLLIRTNKIIAFILLVLIVFDYSLGTLLHLYVQGPYTGNIDVKSLQDYPAKLQSTYGYGFHTNYSMMQAGDLALSLTSNTTSNICFLSFVSISIILFAILYKKVMGSTVNKP